jgi:hypothetical protein
MSTDPSADVDRPRPAPDAAETGPSLDDAPPSDTGPLGAVHPAPDASEAIAVDLIQREDGWHVETERDVFSPTVHAHLEDAELYVRQQAGRHGRAVILRRQPMHGGAVPEGRVDLAHGTEVPEGPELHEDAHAPEMSDDVDPTAAADVADGGERR